jgi:hypothetical protein
MKILDLFNEVAPQLHDYARKGLRYAVMYPVGEGQGRKFLCAAFADEAAARAQTRQLRNAGYNAIRVDLKDAENPRDCLKSYYVPMTGGYKSFP